MPKFLVYEIATASYLVGEYEAENKEEAERLAGEAPKNEQPCLCHQCGDEMDIGDWYEYQTDKI